MIVSVKALVYHNDKYLLLKPTNPNLSINGWDGPGGKVEENESITEALVREVKEESGLMVTGMIPLTTIKFPNNPIQYIIFWCTVDNDVVSLSSEHSEYKWVSVDELKELTKMDPISFLEQQKQLLAKAGV